MIDDARFTQMWGEGATHSEIMRELSIPRGSVTGHVHRLKLTPRGNGGAKPRIDKNEVHRLYKAGMSRKDIAARLGITKEYCSVVLRTHTPKPAVAAAAPVVIAAAPPPPSLPPHPFWTCDRDALILQAKGRHEALSAVARALGRSVTDVQLRWHRLRAGADMRAAE